MCAFTSRLDRCIPFASSCVYEAQPNNVEEIMKTNESSIDRGIRVVVAVVAAIAAYLVGFGSIVGIILLVVAAVMLVTAAVGFCPLYRVFGISTCKVPQNKKVPAHQ